MTMTSGGSDGNHRHPDHDDHDLKPGSHLTSESFFNWMLGQERKRTERTGEPFALMLLDIEALDKADHSAVARAGRALLDCTRDTDIAGWYRADSAIGVIFTSLNHAGREAIRSIILQKINGALEKMLEKWQCEMIEISLQFFPDSGNGKDDIPRNPLNRLLYSGKDRENISQKISSFLKRAVDVAGSLVALAVLSPLFLIIAALLRSTASPVFLRQTRVGRYGREFDILKFGSSASASLTRFLKRTHLEDLPQLINVLHGEMSLVGPRPPAPDDFEHYDIWHRRRIQETKPGITGLWQVSGSQTSFDEMVRLDLQYIRIRSVWLDLKILLKTPLAALRQQ